MRLLEDPNFWVIVTKATDLLIDVLKSFFL